MTPLAMMIQTARERARERQAEMMAHWADLYVAAGRAIEAAERGDVAAVREHLQTACDAEYGYLGDAESFGHVADALDDGGSDE